MYELKKIGKVFTSKFVGTGPSSYNKRIYRAAVSQRLRNTVLGHTKTVTICTENRTEYLLNILAIFLAPIVV